LETTREQCKGCPWANKDAHSLKWPTYVEKMNVSGLIENCQHRCHEIDKNVWDKPDSTNVCIGSLKN